MSTTTTGLGFPIPTESDDVTDGFDAIADLGAALDTYLTPDPIPDYLAVADEVFWSLVSFNLYRVGGLVHMRGEVKWISGAALTVPADGNIGNESVLIVPEGTIRGPLVTASLSSGALGRLAVFVFTPSGTEGIAGTVSLVSLGNSADLEPNATLTFSGFYIEEPA